MCKTCQDILLPLSKNKEEWAEAKYEWKLSGFDFDIKQKCICGCSISKNYTLSNNKTGEERILGSICINTVFEDCKPLLDSINKYVCNHCNKKILRTSKSSHNTSIKHMENVERSKKYRQCETCNGYNILKTRSIDQKDCVSCYLRKNGKKKCWGCRCWIPDKYNYCFKCNSDRKEYNREKLKKKYSL